jgi:hypothetical protein
MVAGGAYSSRLRTISSSPFCVVSMRSCIALSRQSQAELRGAMRVFPVHSHSAQLPLRHPRRNIASGPAALYQPLI